MSSGISIARYSELAAAPSLLPGLDRIFFVSSSVQAFPDEDARQSFRERWLGRYLTHDPDLAFIARDGEGAVIGYVVGATDDPARAPRFADISYFQDFAALTARFPAQLHVNLAPDWRGRGLGHRLVDCFAGAAKAAGAPGLHVVTARGMRNVGFYHKVGFREAGHLNQGSRTLLFLSRAL